MPHLAHGPDHGAGFDPAMFQPPAGGIQLVDAFLFNMVPPYESTSANPLCPTLPYSHHRKLQAAKKIFISGQSEEMEAFN